MGVFERISAGVVCVPDLAEAVAAVLMKTQEPSMAEVVEVVDGFRCGVSACLNLERIHFKVFNELFCFLD